MNNHPSPLEIDTTVIVQTDALRLIRKVANHFKIPLTSTLSDDAYIREIVYSIGNREGYNFLQGDYKTKELIPTLEGLWDRWKLNPSAREYIDQATWDHLDTDDNPIGQFVYDDDSGDLRFRAVIIIDDPIPSAVPSGDILYPEVFETESIFTLEAWLTFYLNFANRYAGIPIVYLTIATADFFERNPFNYDSF